MLDDIMPSSGLNGPGRSCRPEPGSAIPYGLQLSTGELMLPSRRMPYGTACMLVCPHCHAAGRGDDAAIVHVPRGRRFRDNTFSNNYFRHLIAPHNPSLPCYRFTSDSNSVAARAGGGGPETVVHMLGAEFVAWRKDGENGWEWADDRSGKTYPGSSFRFDAVLVKGGRTMAIEVEVTHRIEREKVQYLKHLDWAVLVVDMSSPEVREWLYPRLLEWDRMTMGTENAEPLAAEIFEYLRENNAFQPLENDYYVQHKNT